MQIGFLHLHVHPRCALRVLPMPFSGWLSATITVQVTGQGPLPTECSALSHCCRQPQWTWPILSFDTAHGTCVCGNDRRHPWQRETKKTCMFRMQTMVATGINHLSVLGSGVQTWAGMKWCPLCAWICKVLLHLVIPPDWTHLPG